MEMKMMMVLCLVWFGALFVGNSAGLSCNESVTKMLACQFYFRGEGPATADYGCCKATGDIMKDMDTPQKRRDLCQCLTGTRVFKNVNVGRVKALHDTCGLSGSFPLAPNCNSVGL